MFLPIDIFSYFTYSVGNKERGTPMRDTFEMFDLILNRAKNDEKIRAVFLNGSRTNPTIAPDIFQDYDIVYVVHDPCEFLLTPTWIDCFGERLLIQKVDDLDASLGKSVNFHRAYTYLMLFSDGNRIDLKLMSIERAKEAYQETKLTQLLLDKDLRFTPIISSDEEHWVKRPSPESFYACTNEFWWCLQNVAKGIYREEISYAKANFDIYVRSQLHHMIDWHIGLTYEFQISTGKLGKFYKKLLHEEEWLKYLETYRDASPEQFWKAIYCACEQFHTYALEVAEAFQFSYVQEEEEGMLAYLHQVEHLQKDALTIF